MRNALKLALQRNSALYENQLREKTDLFILMHSPCSVYKQLTHTIRVFRDSAVGLKLCGLKGKKQNNAASAQHGTCVSASKTVVSFFVT